MRYDMLLGDRDYQIAFFKKAIKQSKLSIDDLSADLLIHKNTLKKWVTGEQAAPAIAYSAIAMYLKLLSLGEIFCMKNELQTYKSIFINEVNDEIKKDEFIEFKRKAVSILNPESDDDISDLPLYFLYACLHDKSKVDEVCLFAKRKIQAMKSRSVKGVLTGSAKITGPLLIYSYISQYPDESIQSIVSAYKKGLIYKKVVTFAIEKRLELIDDKYNLYLTDIRWNLHETESGNSLLSKFDFNSDNFSPKEFISMFEQVKKLYIQKHGTDQIDAMRAFSLGINAIHNFDFL